MPSEEDPIALCLYTIWSLQTGRPMPERPYEALTREQLEEFWSDC
ncbi:hypothetical protein [Actinocorallia populi]|nr:hypothetical protein [Actinocorallia populi]